MEDERFLTVAEAARLTGKHRNTMISRITKGELKAEKNERGEYRIRIEDLVFSEGPPPEFAHLIARQLGRELIGYLQENFREMGYEAMGRSYRDELGWIIGDMREQLGREKTLREAAEERSRHLEEELRALKQD